MIAQDVPQIIAVIREVINESLILVEKFPKIRYSPSSVLPVKNLILESEEKKHSIVEELSIINFSVKKLEQRLNLPVLVGVVGRFSSGKSTLLNAFFELLFQKKAPSILLRNTGRTTTTKLFSYITHEDFLGVFAGSEDLEIITTNHNEFKRINFIDTPGNGWTEYNKKEISELLSAADVTLFLFHPYNILDAESVKALYEKFTRFDNVPIWYVVTNGSSYLNETDDPLNAFQRDLIDAKEKLGKRIVFNDEERETRDQVYNRTSFIVNENTFLVDSKIPYGINELLGKIFDEFGSNSAKEAKFSKIIRGLRNEHVQLVKLLNEWEMGLNEIADVLQNTIATKISQSVFDLKNIIVSAKISLLSEKLYSLLRQHHRVYDYIPSRLMHEIPISFSDTVPEITVLRSRIDDLRKDSTESDFILSQKNILVDTELISSQISEFRTKVVDALREKLSEEWSSGSKRYSSKKSFYLKMHMAIEKLKNGEAVDQYPVIKLGRLIPFVVDQKDYILKNIENITEKKAQYLTSYLARKIDSINELFNTRSRTNSVTVFHRQKRLLDQMRLDIPENITKSIMNLEDFILKTSNQNSQLLSNMEGEIKKNVLLLEDQVKEFLISNVFTPLRESINYLFYNNETTINFDEKYLRSLPQFDYSEKMNVFNIDFLNGVNKFKENGKVELNKRNESWDIEFKALSDDFANLTQNAVNVVARLKAINNEVNETIGHELSMELSVIKQSINDITDSIVEDISGSRDIIAESMQESANQREKERKINNIILWVSILAPIIEVIRASFFLDANWFFILISLSIFFTGLVWVSTRNLEDAKIRMELADRIFESKLSLLLNNTEKIISRDAAKLLSRLDENNNDLRRILRKKYDSVLNTLENIDENILDKLDRQVGLAAKLAVDVTGDVNGVEKATVNSVLNLSDSILSKVCDDAPNNLEGLLQEYIDMISKEYLSVLGRQIKQYRSQSFELSGLQAKLGDIEVN